MAMQETQTQLAQMQKMDALGQLTGGVAHDFNNLLMVVSGYIPRIKQAVANDPKGLHAAEAIELAAQRGATLTRQLLSFSRRQSLRPTVVRLGEVLEMARPILTSLLGSAVDHVTAVLPDVWSVVVDANELEIAIVNLTANARDAMSEGGTIAITAENIHLTGEVAGLDGEFVALTVADTGQGIPPDILAKVFDPFFTTKSADKGTGLGLSQVHGFVHQSGGSVVIKSEIGQGTQVTLYLPRATSDSPNEWTRIVGDASSAGRGVLVVEDNADVAEVTRELLQRMGCDAEVVRDAESALARLEAKRFDVILSDIVMTGAMNGLELARCVERRWPNMQIVLATGYSEAAAEAAKDFTVLRKPYQVEDLDWALALQSPSRNAAASPNVLPLHGRKPGRGAKSDSRQT